MKPQIYLVAPPDIEPAALSAALERAAALPDVAVMLLLRGARTDEAYERLARAVAPVAQARDIAVLVEGAPDLVAALGADGLHVDGPVAAVRAAVAALRPDFIVGVGGIGSRHDAMQKGELGIDYVLFGPLAGPLTAADRELARWWSETMEIPGVLSDPEAVSPAIEAVGCEFVALNLALLEPVA